MSSKPWYNHIVQPAMGGQAFAAGLGGVAGAATFNANPTLSLSQNNYRVSGGSSSTLIQGGDVVSAPASGKRTIRRDRLTAMSNMGNQITHKLPTTVMSMPPGKTPLKNAFNQFKKLFEGVTNLENRFTFTMKSKQGKRGVLLIPIRHDAVIYGVSPTNDETNRKPHYDIYKKYAKRNKATLIGDDGSGKDDPRTDLDPTKHIVGDLNFYKYAGADDDDKVAKDGNFENGKLCIPNTQDECGERDVDNRETTSWQTTANMIVPGMSLLHLEHASWKLNSMKVADPSSFRSSNMTDFDNVHTRKPLLVYSDFDKKATIGNVQLPEAGGPDALPDNYVSRRWNAARQQKIPETVVLATGVIDNNTILDSQERVQNNIVSTAERETQYEVQIGSGFIEFDIKNQGSTSCTIECVLIKNKPHVYDLEQPQAGGFENASAMFAENTMSWLRSVVSPAVATDRLMKRSKGMVISVPIDDSKWEASDDVPKQDDALYNPYTNFLPSSGFAKKFFKSVLNVDNSKYNNNSVAVPVSDNGDITVGAADDPQQLPSITNEGFGANDMADPVSSYVSPYMHVGRCYAVVPSGTRRKIKIPLPKLRYNPSDDPSFTTIPDHDGFHDNDMALKTPLSKHGLQLVMSLNGSKSDYFTKDSHAFKGQDYTPAEVFVDAKYVETVYPACATDIDLGSAFNFGKPMQSNLPQGEGATYDYRPGRVISAAQYVPIAQTDAADAQPIAFTPSAY